MVACDEHVCIEGKERETNTILLLCKMTNQPFIN